MPFRRNVSVVGELVYWEYFKKTTRQLGTVPKVMLANSTNIKQAGFGSQVALHVNALYLASMKMILPKYDTLQAKNDFMEKVTKIGGNSAFPICLTVNNFPFISKMRMSELATINLPVKSTWLVTRVLFACVLEWVRLCVKNLSIEI